MANRVLTWILLVIAAFVCAAIAQYLVVVVFDMFDGARGARVALSSWKQMVYGFASGLAFTLAPALLIAKEPRRAALVLFVIGVLWWVLPPVYMLMSYDYMRYRAGDIALPTAAAVIGGLVAVLFARAKAA